MILPETEWLPPTEFPDLSKYDEIAIDLETRDTDLKIKGSGSIIGNGEVVGIGFRYGEARAVGKNVTPERLSRFVKLVRQKINIAFECIHSTPELNPDDIPLRAV